jgi:hypothetical protein
VWVWDTWWHVLTGAWLGVSVCEYRVRNYCVVIIMKVKAVPLQERGLVLPFRDLGARMGCLISITPRPLYPRERPGTHCTRGWVGPRAGLDVCEKSRPNRPARSQSLYRLSYPGPFRVLSHLFQEIYH